MPDSWGLAGGDEIVPGLAAVSSLGGGTVYEAWLAYDERLQAPVVAKLLRPGHVDDPASRTGIEREAMVLQELAHPGIARLFAHDLVSDRPHLVLEHVDGPTLSALVSSYGALPLQQLLPLGIELCSVLHYLHGRGTCHLDVKPSNVVMGAPAKLIDFSVAMDVDAAAALDHPVGSDEYMAPEQCLPGERGPVGPSSDMWGLGATMFRAAAGYRPFDRDPRWAQLTAAPKALPDFVPAAVGNTILSCLAPDPADRPLPVELAARLADLLEQVPQARLSGFSIKL